MTLGNGQSMPTRAGESIARALGNEFGVTYSFKEYEDFVFQFAKKKSRGRNVEDILRVLHGLHMGGDEDYDVVYPKYRHQSDGLRLLRQWRDEIQDLRRTSSLFDTRSWTDNFEYILQATWEATNIAARRQLKTVPAEETRDTSEDSSHKYFYSGLNIKKSPSKSRSKRCRRSDCSEPIVDVANKFKLYHIFSVSKSSTIHNIPLHQAYDAASMIFNKPRTQENKNEEAKNDTESEREYESIDVDVSSISTASHIDLGKVKATSVQRNTKNSKGKIARPSLEHSSPLN